MDIKSNYQFPPTIHHIPCLQKIVSYIVKDENCTFININS